MTLTGALHGAAAWFVTICAGVFAAFVAWGLYARARDRVSTHRSPASCMIGPLASIGCIAFSMMRAISHNDSPLPLSLGLSFRRWRQRSQGSEGHGVGPGSAAEHRADKAVTTTSMAHHRPPGRLQAMPSRGTYPTLELKTAHVLTSHLA